MKPAVYLTDPAEMRRVRLNQPRVTSEQARTQRERLRNASEAGREPVQRNTFYEPIRVWDEPQAEAVAKVETGGDTTAERVRATESAAR